MQAGAEATSQKAKMFIQDYTNSARTMGELLQTYESIKENFRFDIFRNIAKHTLFNSPQFLSVRAILEPQTIISNNDYFSFSYYRTTSAIEYDKSDLSGLNIFTTTQRNLYETVIPPHNYHYQNTVILQNSYTIPILQNNQFIGIVGIDGYSSDFQAYMAKFVTNRKECVFIIDYQKVIITHSTDSLINKDFSVLGYDSSFVRIFDNCRLTGQTAIYEGNNPISNEMFYYAFAPFKISKTSPNMVLVIASPASYVLRQANKSFYFSILTGIIGLIVLSGFVWVIARFITKPLSSITKSLQRISLGDIAYKHKLKTHTNDEISQMAMGVNRLIDGLNSVAGFAAEIGKGNLETEYKPLSKNDLLGKSLNQMRQSLIQSKIEEDIQKHEDDKQSWVTQGIAKFGEILRLNNDNLDKLSSNIVINICSYMNKPQCALFITNNDFRDEQYELVSAYAFGHQKIIQKSVRPGEELIGRVAQDRKTMHIKNTPHEFPVLRPELSTEAVPNNTLIVPLLTGDNALGVVEVLGYQPFEAHEIEFVEKLGANIASTVNSVKINIKTADLLKQSREQKDILAQHEEEMRQNMEEMLATQEETEKRESELKAIMATVNAYTMLAILNTEGKILKINDSLATLFGFPASQMVGKYLDAFTIPDEAARKEFAQLWSEVLVGNSQKKIQKIENRKRSVYLSETYVPIYDDENHDIEQIALIAVDVTKKVEYDREISKLVSEIESHSK
jgi:PAS domain S-box-containing protein